MTAITKFSFIIISIFHRHEFQIELRLWFEMQEAQAVAISYSNASIKAVQAVKAVDCVKRYCNKPKSWRKGGHKSQFC